MSATSPRVLLVCSDLFFSTQLRSAAQSAGAQPDVELQPARVAERIGGGEYRLVVVDLETTGLDIAALIASLPAENRPHVLAFGPHVQAQRLKAARDAGCDTVVPRSIAAQTLVELVSV
jgi:DNA-binding response OmpR family regulator